LFRHAHPLPRPAILAGLAALAIVVLPATAGARVLRVGKYKGIRGQYRTIQAAVHRWG
jgi:hypothetical protein